MGCSAKNNNDRGLLPTIIGERGHALGRFSFPRGIDIDRAGRAAVADKTGRIQIFSPAGAPIREWMLPKMDHGTPTGLVFDQSDPTTETLLIADTHNSRILRYSLAGEPLAVFGEYGGAPGKMIYPTDVAVAPDGTLFITEYGENDRVMVFSRDGRFIRQFGSLGSGPGEFQRPLALVWAPPGRILVADTCNHRIQAFAAADGKFIATWGAVGGGPGQFNYPYDLAISPNYVRDGLIDVVEYGNNRVQRIDAQGRGVALYGKAGTAPGEFGAPWGIATAPDGRLWIADTVNHRLQVLEAGMLSDGLKLAKQ